MPDALREGMNGDPSNTPDRYETMASLGHRPPTKTSPAWSSGQLLDRLGGDEALARELVALFLAEYPRLLSRLHASLASGRAEDVRRAAHAAKGCIVNFVNVGPVDTAFEIEQLGGQGRLESIPPLVSQLERELEELAAGMRRFQTGH